MSRYGQPLGNQFLKATPAQLIVMLEYLDTREYSDRDIQVFMDWVLETRSLVPARFIVDAMGRSGVDRWNTQTST